MGASGRRREWRSLCVAGHTVTMRPQTMTSFVLHYRLSSEAFPQWGNRGSRRQDDLPRVTHCRLPNLSGSAAQALQQSQPLSYLICLTRL